MNQWYDTATVLKFIDFLRQSANEDGGLDVGDYWAICDEAADLIEAMSCQNLTVYVVLEADRGCGPSVVGVYFDSAVAERVAAESSHFWVVEQEVE